MSNIAQHGRFKDAPWYPKGESINIIIGGAGGIGSWVAFLIARAGFKPVIFDDDILEEHNIGGQLYRTKDIRKGKVNALSDIIKDFSNTSIIAYEERIEAGSLTGPYIIAAFDNMTARRDMFDNWCKEHSFEESTALFIDGRLTAEQMQIYCIKGNDIIGQNNYRENHLFDDSEVEDAPCTMKQTSHAAAMIAAHITGFFTNHFTNVVENDTTRAVPFKWEYFIPMDLQSVEDN